VKSILLGGRDVMNEGFDPAEAQAQFDVVLGADGGSVEGRVLDQRLQPVVNAVVVLVPGPTARKRADLYKDTWSDGAGRFRFTNIPPGEYTMFAWEYVDDGLWQDTEFMRREESRGRPARIGSGARETIDLTVLARPR
jgi:protocatechuate 3,4-dioxygenase beta subunit